MRFRNAGIVGAGVLLWFSVLAVDHDASASTTTTTTAPRARTNTSTARQGRQSQRRRHLHRRHRGRWQGFLAATSPSATLSVVVDRIPSGGGSAGSSTSRAAAPSTSYSTVEGQTSIPNEVMNLVKSILGAGVLGVSAGIAAFGDAPSALVAATALLFAIAALSGYGFALIGTVCSKTRSSSYRDAWSRSVGPNTSWIPALACFLVTSCTVITCSIILADTIPTVVDAVVGSSGGNAVLSRNAALISVMLLLAPLCLMQELRRLAPFSFLGLAGTMYTAVAMSLRYFWGSYGPDRALTETLPPEGRPRFGVRGWEAAGSTHIAILISMLSSAFMCHYNSAKFFWELKDNTLPRFYAMVASSFGISAVCMSVIAAAGFATFGASSAGMILSSYSPADALINAGRAAMVVSLFFGYPLAFVGVREQLLDLLGVRDARKRQELSTPVTFAILSVVTALAWNLRDIRVILTLGGMYRNRIV